MAHVLGYKWPRLSERCTVMEREAVVATNVSSGSVDLSSDGLDLSSADCSDISVSSSSAEATDSSCINVAGSSAKTDGTTKTAAVPKAELVELESPSNLEVQR